MRLAGGLRLESAGEFTVLLTSLAGTAGLKGWTRRKEMGRNGECKRRIGRKRKRGKDRGSESFQLSTLITKILYTTLIAWR